jgi:hypothetical protein
LAVGYLKNGTAARLESKKKLDLDFNPIFNGKSMLINKK